MTERPPYADKLDATVTKMRALAFLLRAVSVDIDVWHKQEKQTTQMLFLGGSFLQATAAEIDRDIASARVRAAKHGLYFPTEQAKDDNDDTA